MYLFISMRTVRFALQPSLSKQGNLIMRKNRFLIVFLLVSIVCDIRAEVPVQVNHQSGLLAGVGSSKNSIKRSPDSMKLQRQSLSKVNASFPYFEDYEEDEADDVCETQENGAEQGMDAGNNADFRVRRALEAARVGYSIGPRGDFEVKWTTEGQRTHTSYIYSHTYNHDGVEFRKIWAAGFVTDKINANNLLSLLKLNSTYAIGAWEVKNLDNGQLVAIFSVNVPADATGDYLRIVSSTVAQTADGIELTATREDNL